jgi:hypothetical protein
VRDWITAPEHIRRRLEKIREIIEEEPEIIEERLEDIEGQIAGTEQKLVRLLDLYVDGEMDKQLLGS